MAEARTWNLRLNLDAFNAALAALVDDAERVQFLAGLSAGANAGRCREGAPPAWAEGFTLGIAMRQEADAYRDQKVLAGQRSAERRRNTAGTAQPKKRGNPERPPNGVRENPERTPERAPNQSTIHNPSEKLEEATASSSPEPQAPALLLIPCTGTGPKAWPLTQQKLDEWNAAFPGVDVPGEIRKAVQWLRDNPSRGKTARGMSSFLGRWLGRAQDSLPPQQKGAQHGNRTTGPAAHRFAERDANLAAQLAARNPAPPALLPGV